MRTAAPTLHSSLRALRGVAAVVVAVGYLAALNATAIGHGWRLVPHLALEHGSAIAAPGVLESRQTGAADETGAVILTTLRNTHRHGGHVHSHGPHSSEADTLPTSRTHARSTSESGVALEGDFHEHDGMVHSHGPPPAEETAVAVVSLDKHRPSSSATVPAAPTSALHSVLEVGEGFTTRGRDVETPPPIGWS
ncbi:hypothetical protein [Rubrivirga sp.]|uniref:hypothetical protein n=1 Tax=Rubrivirga sp. TaxID=1885344 RepID=UPI003C744B3A